MPRPEGYSSARLFVHLKPIKGKKRQESKKFIAVSTNVVLENVRSGVNRPRITPQQGVIQKKSEIVLCCTVTQTCRCDLPVRSKARRSPGLALGDSVVEERARSRHTILRFLLFLRSRIGHGSALNQGVCRVCIIVLVAVLVLMGHFRFEVAAANFHPLQRVVFNTMHREQ